MQELIARLGAIFSQLGEQVQAALQNPDTGAAIAAAIDVILPVACGILRVVAIPIAILIIVRCLMSLFREKTGKEIWGWLTLADGTKLDLCHWENAIGRGAWVDVSLDFPTVSAATPPCSGTIRGTGNSNPANQKRHPAQREKSHPHHPP